MVNLGFAIQNYSCLIFEMGFSDTDFFSLGKVLFNSLFTSVSSGQQSRVEHQLLKVHFYLLSYLACTLCSHCFEYTNSFLNRYLM